MGAIELFLTLIGAAATALLLGLFAHDAINSHAPTGRGTIFIFAADFYPVEGGTRRRANSPRTHRGVTVFIFCSKFLSYRGRDSLAGQG